MTWFKVDDHLHSHSKTWAASLTAMGLWTVAGSWSSDQLTDGFIPEHMIPALSRGQVELAEELVKAGFWERAQGGYQFHEWAVDADGTVRNPTRDEAIAGRKKMSSGGELGNHRRWHEGKGKTDPSCRYCQKGGPGNGGRGASGASSGMPSGSHRVAPNPMSDSPVDNSQPDASDTSSDQQGYRVPDRVVHRVPDSPPNPPVPVPSQSRPVPPAGGSPSGEGEGDQSVYARARVREALRWLSSNYGLTDPEAADAWEAAKARAADPIRNPIPYLQRMVERGHLADIVGAIQTRTEGQAAGAEPGEELPPPELRFLPGGATSDSAATQPPLFIHAVPDEPDEPDADVESAEAAPLYDTTSGEDYRAAAPLLADLKRKWAAERAVAPDQTG
ncbi:hypothetical protein [Actinomadura litoris]|uniref:Uncharacterized protein n=1 Tax=Actinomadura litoris TaxID=2678616 RepID=A0A7K1LAL5_9ACTN|nr:hypothetical protein [Actinomadura litoris]MUN41477.1 hypothetical protein [Actinomadura litoris]